MAHRESFEDYMRGAAREGAVPAPYDFRRTEKFTADQNRHLERIFVAFSEAVVIVLAPLLQTRFRMELAGISSRSYSAYINALPEPTPMLVFSLEDTRGVLDMEFDLAFALFERLMGGPGVPPREETRLYFTELEKAVLRKPLARMVEAYNRAWKDVKPVQAAPASLEFNPMAVHIAPPSETMVVVAFQCEMGAAQGRVDLCIPFRYLKENLPRSSYDEHRLTRAGGGEAAAQQVAPIFAKNLEKARVPVAASLGRAEILFEDLLTLEVGDTIRLDTEIREPLRIKVNDRTKFLAHPGIKDGKLAAKISRVLQEGEEEEFDE